MYQAEDEVSCLRTQPSASGVWLEPETAQYQVERSATEPLGSTLNEFKNSQVEWMGCGFTLNLLSLLESARLFISPILSVAIKGSGLTRCVAVKLNFWPYIRQYTSRNENFEDRSCVDPESFCRGGPTLRGYFVDEGIQIPLKAGHHWPAREMPFKWPFIECWLVSFVIF